MAVMDEFREEREAIKNAPMKKKILYFWDYYKLQTIIVVAVIAVIIGFIYVQSTNTEALMNGILLNCYSSELDYTPDNLANDFLENQGVDTKKYSINFISDLTYDMEESNVYSLDKDSAKQTITVYSEAGDLDFVTGSFEDLMDIAYKGVFVDLSEVLSEDEYAMYESYFLYLDMDVYEKRKEMLENGGDTSSIQIPDCTDKDAMKEPIPVLIDMSQSEVLMKIYNHSIDNLAIGLGGNEGNMERTREFVDYLMNH